MASNLDSPIPFLPCTDDAQGGLLHDDAPIVQTLAAGDFAYLGASLSLDAFIAYVQTYDFGTIPPSQIILHNTANPAATWAPSPGVPNWDAGESGMSEAQIRTKRAKQLANIRDFYIGKGWNAGPHLFVDERYIWLFTPMGAVGIHANAGNSYHIGGKFRYSIGVEVVGRYATQRWPSVIIRQLRGVVGALSHRLGIAIVYTPAPIGQPTKHDGQLALHRDYTTEKDCPGKAIDPLWMTKVLAQETPPPKPPVAVPYMATHTQAVFESPAPDGKIALGGQAEIAAGTAIGIDEIKAGWAHLSNGVGFVPSGILEKL